VPANQSRKETAVPLHTPAISIPPLRRLGHVAALGAATFATAGAVFVIADDQSAAQLRTIAEPSHPVATRYFDIEANKAASMRALSRHIAHQRATSVSRYKDLEANKARGQRMR
jgi:hypothetical protein